MILVSVLLMCGGAACLVAFNLIGSTVEPDGRLNEPFGPIPVGFLLVGLGLVVGLLYLLMRRVQALRQPRPKG
jgi:hypothetical protein